jgi:SAM-dependent MidA family methyltransferase
MKNTEEMLTEFQSVFETPNTPEFWAGLVREENRELVEAAGHFLKEAADFLYVVQGAINAGATDEQLEGVRQESRLALELFDAIPLDIFAKALELVHENNMSKRQPDGSVKRREDGKVLKPDNYKPVDLTPLLG